MDTDNQIMDSTDPLGVARPLFEIIRQDTPTLLQLLRQILDDMEIDILDDAKMEDRLFLWRQTIGPAQLEPPEPRESIRSFLIFLQLPSPPARSTAIVNAPDNENDA